MAQQAKGRLAQLASHFHLSQPAHAHKFNRAELSPTYFLPRAAIIEPNAEAIVHLTANGKVLRRSYQEFADRARGLAYYIKNKGYKRVGILAPNTPAFLESIYGIAAGGALQVGINYRLKAADIHYIFEHAEVDCIIVDREYVGLLEGFNPKVDLLIDDDTDFEAGAMAGPFDHAVAEGLKWDRENGKKGWEGLHLEAGHEDDLIGLAYTSGTTARPKGVEFTHRGAYLAAISNVVESGLNVQNILSRKRAKYLSILPFFHAAGWCFPWSVVSVRGTHYCLRKIDYDYIWKLLHEEGISHFNAAPTVNTLLCANKSARKLESPVRVTVAASPPTAKLFEDMINLNLFPVHVYGLTETYGPITKGYFLPEWLDLPPDEMYRKMARQGHGFLCSKMVRVIKPDMGDQVIDVKKNGQEIGEIVFTGNICSKGYHKDPEATAKLFAGGVLHSGDLAVWHEDGAIQILDRAKDIIISGGENISSVSLEGIMVRHPDILEVGVVGVADSHYGERPKAYITVQQGATVDEKEIIRWCKQDSGMAGFMVPREVEFVKELPKTETGKIKKNVLREWAKGNMDAK